MKKEFELLAPGGDIDSIKAAVAAGADAIYCGLDKFNARNRASNLLIDDLPGILRLAHKNNCKVFLTLNIIIIDSEIPALFKLLNKLVNTNIDGVIVQDIGMLYLLRKYFINLEIHASTQLTTHNEGQIKFLSKLEVKRVNLSRELNISEIKKLTKVAHNNDIQTEVFVHGSYCLSFSGLCYFSSVQSGNSGNRGTCSQPCRDQYITTPAGNNFPLNLKDNSAFLDLPALADAKVDSLKIEGRIKKYHYVFSIVESWRKQLKRFYRKESTIGNKAELYNVFNRDFSNSFLSGKLDKEMFIDNPRDYSAINRAKLKGDLSEVNLEIAKKEIYDERTEIINLVKTKIKTLSIEKAPLTLIVSGKLGTPLKIELNTPEKTYQLFSKSNLEKNNHQSLNKESILKKLNAIDSTEYYIEKLVTDDLQAGLFISFNELTALKKQVLFLLNNSKEQVNPIEVPRIEKENTEKTIPTLSIIISDVKDLKLIKESTSTIYYKLPNSLNNSLPQFVKIFTENKSLIPWFPAVLIDNDYTTAKLLLKQIPQKHIVTNNTGIAYEAYHLGIKWIAGPYLNCSNSYSLISLKENFNCSGAFISNELNKIQIKKINKPENFDLYYSIYHPIKLMTSRQCLFHQVTACEKNKLDSTCIQQCESSTTITNLKNEHFILEKSKGNYHRIYNNENFLNTEIINDIPKLFSSFFIDLSNIKTATKIVFSKTKTIQYFEQAINNQEIKTKQDNLVIYPTTKKQYFKGF